MLNTDLFVSITKSTNSIQAALLSFQRNSSPVGNSVIKTECETEKRYHL